ncbi:MAG: segregation/condensation protein A [Phycisphaerae bacterium]|nr:segregation/condensation protein A [Phycisphaerae bacterium]
MAEYRVNLDIYSGPMDLLLYLIRRDEVDIHDIPIANITAQYVSYIELLQQLDPNLAGDFLVLAATLMEIKTRMLLPAPEVEEGQEAGAELDPREDLVRQLLQYKAFKDAAGDLQSAALEQSMKYPRKPAKLETGDGKDYDIEDVQVWDIFDAFRDVMAAIGQSSKHHEIIYDDTPLELLQEDLLDMLTRDGKMTFKKVFAGRESRSEVVGLFLAMLELVRLMKITYSQGEVFGEIFLEVNPNPPEIVNGIFVGQDDEYEPPQTTEQEDDSTAEA